MFTRPNAAGLLALGLIAAARPAHASPPAASASATPTSPSPLYAPAPWWAREPVIVSAGEVRAHLLANRARFAARFSAVDETLPGATQKAGAKVKTLAQTLAAFGADRVQVESGLTVTPIYQQYRDKQGELQSNERADKIERYEASVRFDVNVEDVSALEKVYAAVVAAGPSSVDPVSFRLEPGNEVNDELYHAAVGDAARRARLSAEATGARLGRVLVIDPTARACETDVLLAGAPRLRGEDAGGVRDVMVTGARLAKAPAPAPPPAAALDGLPLQPPLTAISRRACVVYAID